MSNNANEPKKKMTSKQVLAIIGVILLVLLYIITLLAAIFDSSASGNLFMICIIASVAVPILIWMYSYLFKLFTRKNQDS